MMTDPRYTPPEIAGFVNWSNMTRDEAGRIIPMDDLGKQYCIMTACGHLAVPESAVRVERFVPNDRYNSPIWTVYIAQDYSEAVEMFKLNLVAMLRQLERMRDLEEGSSNS